MAKATEFGGNPVPKTGGIQPATVDGLPAHQMDASERLSQIYNTGQELEPLPPDNGEVMTGLLPLEEQIKLRQAAGDMP